MNQFLKLSFIGASVLMLGGCKKFVDVNQNLNNLTATKAQFVFTGALNNTYRNQVSGAVHIVPATWVGHYGHSTSFTGGGSEKTYEFTSADFNAFDGLFDNLNDYEYVKNNATKDGVGFWKDPADIMQCYVYQQLVDLYGNVPYTEALKGVENITPAYTDQKTIYENLVVRIDSSMARIARTTWPTAGDITQQDIFFQGNKDAWIRFANTLKLRILMRQVYVAGRETYITDNIARTAATGYLTANVLVSAGYQNIAGKLNPFYANYGFNELNNIISNHQYRKMGAVLIDWLKTSDTSASIPPARPSAATRPAANAFADTFRLQGLAWPIGTTVTAPSANLNSYIGIPLGAGSGYATASSSPIGPFVIRQGEGTRVGMFMLLAEALFLQAEAKQRYPALTFTAGATAEALYNAGVLAHFRTVAAPSTAGNAANAGDAPAARYLARPKAYNSFAASPNPIRAIQIQKWISLVHINGLEAWSEYRKTNGTADVSTPYSPRTVATTPNAEPVRYLYPLTETQTNATNVPKNISRFTSRIFWDVN